MTHAQDVIRESEKVPTLNARMGTGGNQVPILMENIPKTIGCDLYNGSVSGDQAVSLTAASGTSANHSGPAVAYCIAGNMVDRETTMHGLGVSENVSSTLTSADRHAVAYDAYQHHNWREAEQIGPLTTHGNGVRGDTPLVADMSITGGAECVCNRQRTDGTVEDAGQSRNAELYARSNRYHAETCNGKQVVGSLCAHDYVYNGQDVDQGKLIVEYEADND